jgi:RNA polymerase sigma-70 factor (ECF subfamily)
MDLESTVAELAPGLLRFCRAQVRREALAEEAAQDALVALVRRWRRRGPPQSPSAFTFAIARRRAIRAALRERLLSPLDAMPLRFVATADPRPAAEARSELTRVRRDLATLSRREREAFLLVVVGGLAARDAAAVLAIGESALKMRVSRARRQLLARREETSR